MKYPIDNPNPIIIKRTDPNPYPSKRSPRIIKKTSRKTENEVIVPIVMTMGKRFLLYSVSPLMTCKANHIIYTIGTQAIKLTIQYNLAGADAIELWTMMM